MFSQEWSWEAGSNRTEYLFVDSQGNTTDYIKPAAGLHFQISLDHSFYKHPSSKDSVVVQVNKGFWSIFKYRLDVGFNQFNSTGSVKNVSFNYNTDFVRAGLGLGPDIPLFGGLSVGLRATVSWNKFLAGHQEIGSQYFDLAQNKDFKEPRLFLGYSIRLVKDVHSVIRFFAHYQVQANQKEAGSSLSNVLLLNPTTISIGILIVK